MTQPLLSILIPTVVGREESFNILISKLIKGREWEETNTISDNFKCGMKFSKDGELFIRYHCDNKKQNIGEKREQLYIGSLGKFSWQIDDDDDIADNAIELILQAIKDNPDVDCITFEEHIDIDGRIQRSNHSLKYDDWANDTDGYDYVRTPFMKSVIRTDIVRSVPIPHIRFGEDHQWAQRLKLVLKTEYHINQQLYKYIHISSPHNERYGFDKQD